MVDKSYQSEYVENIFEQTFIGVMGNQNIERIPQFTFLISTYVSHSISPNPVLTVKF